MRVKDDLEEVISNHMDNQPYSVKCMSCGKTLICSSKLDKELDLSLEVEPCDCCKEEE